MRRAFHRLGFSIVATTLLAACGGGGGSQPVGPPPVTPSPSSSMTPTPSPTLAPSPSPTATPNPNATFTPLPAPQGSPAALTSFALSGVEENVIAPGSAGLQYTPDEHMTYLRAPGGGSFALWASGGGNYGSYRFATPDLFALGTPASVLQPAGPGTAAFDADYAGAGSVFPAANGSDLLMIYHAENHFFGGVDYPAVPFYAGIGLARSSDGGMTWQKQGEIISGHDPQLQTQAATGAGALTPSAVEVGGYVYVIFREIDLQSNVQGYGIARSPIASDAAPGSWQKYDAGSFSTPGLGGAFTPLGIVLDPAVPSDMRQPDVSFNTYLNEFVMDTVGNGGIYVLTSPDLINWSAGLLVLPASAPDTSPTTTEPHNWFPTLISANEPSDELTGQTGYLYYAKFSADGTAHHYMYRRAFTITATPATQSHARRGPAAAAITKP